MRTKVLAHGHSWLLCFQGMSALSRLERWCRSQCNFEWEHAQGVRIETLDNPGWSLEVSLKGTSLEGAEFKEQSYGVRENAETDGENWLICKVEQKVFKGNGGPFKLEEMIVIFLEWADRNR